MREGPGINSFRNGPTREKAQRMAASRWTSEWARSPLFAEQIPAPDPGRIVAEYRRKAEGWERMERRFIWRAHHFRGLVAHRVSAKELAELDSGGAGCQVTQPTGPTFGGSSWSGSLAASHKGRRAGGSVARKSMGQWYLASITSTRGGPEATRPKVERTRYQQYLATVRPPEADSRMISVSKCPRKRSSTERRRSLQGQPPHPARRPHGNGNGLLTDGPRSPR